MTEQDNLISKDGVSRRSFLEKTSAALVAAASLPILAAAQQTKDMSRDTHTGINEKELGPKNPGLEAQEQAFAYGVKVTGCTVHFVDEELDHGAIIVQKAIPVLETDDEHTLASRILEQEHVAYSEAINIVLDGKYEVAGRRLVTRLTAE